VGHNKQISEELRIIFVKC